MQSTRSQAEKSPSCHHSGQGAENKEVPGRGAATRGQPSCLAGAGSQRGNEWTGGSLGGQMPMGGQLSMLRARQREER